VDPFPILSLYHPLASSVFSLASPFTTNIWTSPSFFLSIILQLSLTSGLRVFSHRFFLHFSRTHTHPLFLHIFIPPPPLIFIPFIVNPFFFFFLCRGSHSFTLSPYRLSLPIAFIIHSISSFGLSRVINRNLISYTFSRFSPSSFLACDLRPLPFTFYKISPFFSLMSDTPPSVNPPTPDAAASTPSAPTFAPSAPMSTLSALATSNTSSSDTHFGITPGGIRLTVCSPSSYIWPVDLILDLGKSNWVEWSDELHLLALQQGLDPWLDGSRLSRSCHCC